MKHWEAALSRLPENEPITIAEVGVWTGSFSEKILTNRPLAKMIQVDRWKKYSEDENIVEGNSRMSRHSQNRFDFAKEMNRERMKKFHGRVTLLDIDSTLASEFVRDLSLDMVFHDASHSYEKLNMDLKAWLYKVKKGGWIGGHDYPKPGRPGVVKAVDECFGNNVEVDDDWTWWVRVK